MIGTLVSFILLLIIAGFIWWAAQQLLGLVPTSEPFTTLIRIVLAAIVLVIVIYAIVLLLEVAGISVTSPLHGMK